MKLEDAYVHACNNFYDNKPVPEQDEITRNQFLEYRKLLLETPKEEHNNNRKVRRILIEAAEIYARAKWEEACIATRKSMTEESGVMPEFIP